MSEAHPNFPNLHLEPCNYTELKEELNSEETKLLPHSIFIKQEDDKITTDVKNEADVKLEHQGKTELSELETELIIKVETTDNVSEDIKSEPVDPIDEAGYENSTSDNKNRENVATSSFQIQEKAVKCELSKCEGFNSIALGNHSAKRLKCNVCSYTSVSKFYLIKHMARHSEKKLYKCDQCNYKTFLKSNAQRHKAIHEKNHFKCNSCDYISARKRRLKRHMLCHFEKKLNCNMCSYSTYEKYRFKKHVLLHSSNDKPFKCKFCTYSTCYNHTLKVHAKLHTRARLYICDQCDFKAAYFSVWKKHKKIHNATLNKCDKCSYKSKCRTTLVRHKKIHSENNFRCNLCPYSFPHMCELKRHVEFYHPTQRLYRCDRCDYGNKDISLLVVHMKTHLE